MPAPSPLLDCVIIGAGAAGLTAATYLARFRRQIQVLDAGASRMLWIPTSHNFPGFAGGVHGEDLLVRLREQAARYGADIATCTVDRIDKLADGTFVAVSGLMQWHARSVILATGVVDIAPLFPDLKRAVAAGCVRYCPVCDGFEAIGKRVAVVGWGKGGMGEALFVRHFADSLSLLSIEEPIRLTADEQEKMRAARIDVVAEPVALLAYDSDETMYLQLRDGNRLRFDVVYFALGTQVNSGLARKLGAACGDKGDLLVDAHQQTAVDGLYAAGDVVAGLNQIAVAMGQAAVAATAIHNRLRM
ncbi:NAD(P)/FAD-dependent oxidoreductase [Noviherbaspirillum agri]